MHNQEQKGPQASSLILGKAILKCLLRGPGLARVACGTAGLLLHRHQIFTNTLNCILKYFKIYI